MITAPIQIGPQGRGGISRSGTGCATPGRSEAVSRTKPGRAIMTSARNIASELEIDEGIACPLCDHN